MDLTGKYRLIACAAAFTVPVVTGCGGGGGGGSAVPVTMKLTASATSPSEVALSWTADPSTIIGYDIVRNGTAAWPTHLDATAFNDINLAAATRYCYTVYAVAFLLGRVGQSNTACVSTSATAAGWKLATVGVGSSVALALDAANADHVSFRNASGVEIATDSGGTWSVENIDGAAGASGPTAIAVSATGSVHTSYYDSKAGSLHYATNQSGAWVGNTVDTNNGWANALGLDSAGNAHVSYANNAFNSLAYATNASGTWATTVVLPGSSSGGVQRTSIALDTAGAAHIAYAVGSGICAIQYAENASGSWSNNTVIDMQAQCGVGLAIDANNIVHIAYMKSNELHYATNRSGSWVSSVADAMSWLGGAEVSIAIDSAGGVHISYQDALNSDLKYATNTSGIWQSQFVATNGSVGGQSQIRVDSTGKVHIAFTDETAGTVRLASQL